jgi:hypothetical protein
MIVAIGKGFARITDVDIFELIRNRDIPSSLPKDAKATSLHYRHGK